MGAIGRAIKNIFVGPKTEAPSAPSALPEPPAEPGMAEKEDPEITQARKKQRRLAAQASGFNATILTGPKGVTTEAPVSRPTLGSG